MEARYPDPCSENPSRTYRAVLFPSVPTHLLLIMGISILGDPGASFYPGPRLSACGALGFQPFRTLRSSRVTDTHGGHVSRVLNITDAAACVLSWLLYTGFLKKPSCPLNT